MGCRPDYGTRYRNFVEPESVDKTRSARLLEHLHYQLEIRCFQYYVVGSLVLRHVEYKRKDYQVEHVYGMHSNGIIIEMILSSL